MSKLGKTMYATTTADDLTSDGYGWIHILTEFNEPNSEFDMISYPADKDYDRYNLDILASLDAAGYQVVGSITEACNGVIVPVALRS